MLPLPAVALPPPQIPKGLAQDPPGDVRPRAADGHAGCALVAPGRQVGGAHFRRHLEPQPELFLPSLRRREGLHPELEAATVGAGGVGGALAVDPREALGVDAPEVPVGVGAEDIEVGDGSRGVPIVDADVEEGGQRRLRWAPRVPGAPPPPGSPGGGSRWGRGRGRCASPSRAPDGRRRSAAPGETPRGRLALCSSKRCGRAAPKRSRKAAWQTSQWQAQAPLRSPTQRPT